MAGPAAKPETNGDAAAAAEGAAAPTDAAAGERDEGLARPLQEHLAQQLRATYHVIADKPAYLGDPALPPAFEHQLHRLDAAQRERIHERGVEAVEAALQDIGEKRKGD